VIIEEIANLAEEILGYGDVVCGRKKTPEGEIPRESCDPAHGEIHEVLSELLGAAFQLRR
jgi:hypothetical protein